MYIEAQMAYQRIVADQAWSQPSSAHHQQQGAVLKANIGEERCELRDWVRSWVSIRLMRVWSQLSSAHHQQQGAVLKANKGNRGSLGDWVRSCVGIRLIRVRPSQLPSTSRGSFI